MPKVFGWEHLTFMSIYLLFGVALLIIAKKYIKEEKGQIIFIKSLAVATLICNILTRIGVGMTYGWVTFFPSTVCSLTSFSLPLVVIFGKKNLNVYHGLWYIAIVGGIGSTLYPDYIGQNASIFFLPTICSLLHHAFIVLLSISMIMFNWFRPSIRKWYYFPLVFSCYITVGTFALHVLKIENAMSITVPLIEGTPINCWFILGVGTALEVSAVGLYEIVHHYYVKRKRTQVSY